MTSFTLPILKASELLEALIIKLEEIALNTDK